MHRKPGSHQELQSPGWAAAEVLQVVSETNPNLTRQHTREQVSSSDPRLGSVWMVRMALSPYTRNSTANKGGQSDSAGLWNNNDMADFFQGGDLLLMHCETLGRLVMILLL
jgi:hypothetical protein